MLTDDQRYQIIKAFSKGFPDTVIAQKLKDVNHMQVYNFRRKLKISSATILENRYNTWIQMINSGVGVDVVAELYGIQPASVSIMLLRKKNFSVVEAAKAAQAKRNSKFAARRKGSRGPFDW